MYRPDGRKYVGQWLNGKQHGRGVYTNNIGEQVDAEWQDGKKVRLLGTESSKTFQQVPQDGNNQPTP